MSNFQGGGAAPSASNVAPFLRSYLAGLVLSRSSATVLGIAAGVANDSTNLALMTLATFTKSTAGAWASGTGSNGMGNGLTIANSTWYHVILANNGGTPDIYFDTSATGANRPAGITDTKVRRIGSFLTDGSAQIVNFIQDGDLFRWSTPVSDLALNNPGTSAVTRALTVPTGVRVRADFSAGADMAAVGVAPGAIYFSDLSCADVAAGTAAFNFISLAQSGAAEYQFGNGPISVMTNTSAQIRTRVQTSTANVTFYMVTMGWADRRGQDA